MITRKTFVAAAVTTVVVGSASAFGFAAMRGERAQCPGKIRCPLTGDMICKDRCPLVDPNRDDCPGRIECPLDGELVCKDRCPLTAANEEAQSDSATGDCCAGCTN